VIGDPPHQCESRPLDCLHGGGTLSAPRHYRSVMRAIALGLFHRGLAKDVDFIAL